MTIDPSLFLKAVKKKDTDMCNHCKCKEDKEMYWEDEIMSRQLKAARELLDKEKQNMPNPSTLEQQQEDPAIKAFEDERDLVLATNGVDLLVDICHGKSTANGWWLDKETGKDMLEAAGRFAPYIIATKMALIHSEVSEALEGDRRDKMDEHLPQFNSLTVELADAIVRIADLAGKLKLPLGSALMAKLEYNDVRPDHKMENRVKTGGKKY